MRAFSLFAPLVGTSVMIIAVIVASVLVNNDIRTSRGITASYSRGELAGVAESIRAFVFSTTADTVIGAVRDSLAVPPNPALEVICPGSGACKSGMADAIGDFAPTGIKNTILNAYDTAVNVFVGSVGGASAQNWLGAGKVRDTLGAQILQKFEPGNPAEGEDPKDSYVTIGPGSLKPEDYTLVLSKGDIIESVPLLPPQGLRIKLPWRIHALSDTLADASGWAMATANLYSTCHAETECGSDDLAIKASWTGPDYRGDDRCATNRNTVINRIHSELAGRVSIKDFDIVSFDVVLRDESITRPSRTECCACCGSGSMCPSEYKTYYDGYVTIKDIKVDWKVKSKNQPLLNTKLIFKNAPF